MVTIVAVFMIALSIRFMVIITLTCIDPTGMLRGMGMSILAIMAILIMAMVMSHPAIVAGTNTVEKTTAICTNMGATDWKSTCMHMRLIVTWSNMCPRMLRISTCCTGR